MSDNHNVGDQSKQTILSSAKPTEKSKMNEQEFIDYIKGFNNPAPEEFIRYIKHISNPASEEFIDYAEGVGLWILRESERGTREDIVSYNGERFPVTRKGQNELLKDHAEILLDTVRRYRTAVSEKRWEDAVKCLKEANDKQQHCLKLRENDVDVALLAKAVKALAGMQRGRENRWEISETERLKRAQLSLNEVRNRDPQLNKTRLIREAAELGEASESYIWKQLRRGRLAIPSK